MNLKRVILGMPGYSPTTGTRALWRATRGTEAKTPTQALVGTADGSLLAHNFNTLWCRALNESLKRKIDYFAMIHSDIDAEDYWLDTLIEELEEKNLDVLGAAVPIKDPRGLTSLALARDDGDNYRPLCRLTMDEVFRLPETFTSEDVGHPLLLNTGCWVCKFNPVWARQVHFTINDCIVFDAESGQYQPRVESEDWYFSRRCHALGLKLRATRKVPLMHLGSMRYSGCESWGSEKFDSQNVPASVVGGIPAPV